MMSNCKKMRPVFSPNSFLNQRSLGLQFATQNKLLNQRLRIVKNLYRRDLRAHFGCVNAIEFSHGDGEWIVSGGDDRRVLLWNVHKSQDSYGRPVCMKGEHHSNIFCLAFAAGNKKVYSGGNDEQVIVHDATTGETLNVFLHEDAVYGLSVDPVNDNIFASACDDGRVLLYDTRAPSDEDPFCLANYTSPMHAVMFNPAEPRLVATANSREGLGLWDVRKPRSCLIRYGGSLSQQSCMSVRINRTGDQVIGLRRRLPPVLYNLHSAHTMYQFDHSGYYNSCTMKSCCFAGDKDQYIISGSDDFNLYMWKIPEEGCSDWVGKAHLVLRGHRSIVNQVRFNPANHLIISSGVEKVIKMWSPFPLLHGSGDLGLSPDTDERSVYTHEEYINLVLRTGQFMTHDYSNESTEEDPRMMAFFDSLVQRELEGWSSEDSFSSRSPIHDNYVHSDSSLRSSPVTADEVQTIATDAILRFFSPVNALTNRNTRPIEASTPVTSTDRNDENSNRENRNQEVRTILDMDQHVSNLANQQNNVVNGSNESVNPDNEIESVNRDNESETVNHDNESESINQDSESDNQGDDNTTSVNNSEAMSSSMSVSVFDQTTLSSTTDTVSENTSLASNQRTTGGGSQGATEGDNERLISQQRVQVAYNEINVASTSSGVQHDPTNRAESYISISELIQQKRKDYLIGIKKLEKRALRRKVRTLARRKAKLKRIRQRLLPGDNNNESDTGSDEHTDDETDDIKEAQISTDEKSSSDSASQSDNQAVVNEIIEKRQQLLKRVKKFKKLRARVLNEDSSDSEPGVSGVNGQSSNIIPTPVNGQSSNIIPTPVNGQSSNIIPTPVYEDISNDSSQEDSTTLANGGQKELAMANGGQKELAMANGGQKELTMANGGQKELAMANGGQKELTMANGGQKELTMANGGQKEFTKLDSTTGGIDINKGIKTCSDSSDNYKVHKCDTTNGASSNNHSASIISTATITQEQTTDNGKYISSNEDKRNGEDNKCNGHSVTNPTNHLKNNDLMCNVNDTYCASVSSIGQSSNNSTSINNGRSSNTSIDNSKKESNFKKLKVKSNARNYRKRESDSE